MCNLKGMSSIIVMAQSSFEIDNGMNESYGPRKGIANKSTTCLLWPLYPQSISEIYIHNQLKLYLIEWQNHATYAKEITN